MHKTSGEVAGVVGARVGRPVRRTRPARRRGVRRHPLAWVGVALGVLVVAALVGVSTASVEGSFGPHRARYEATFDGAVTVDLGPLGAVVVDSPLPLALGGRVVVKEIPREGSLLQDISTVQALAGDLQEYIGLISAPRAAEEVAVRTLVVDAARRTALIAVVLVLGLVGGRAVLGSRRRGDLVTAGRGARRPLGGAAVVASVAAVVGLGQWTAEGRASRSSEVFDGTALEGAVITGRLAGVVDAYGGQIMELYRQNEAFYDRAAHNMTVAWEEPHVGDGPSLDDGGRHGPNTVGEAGGEDPVVMLVVSDLHCNVGMARVIGAAVRSTGASIVLNAGDTTMNGTAVESHCVTTFDQALPDGVTMVVADGNHDSATTAEQERAAGWTVLDGQVVEVDGVRILGDADPRATRVSQGTFLRGPETRAEAAERLEEVACADRQGVHVLLTHHVRLGDGALSRGCVQTQVSGHFHRRVGPEVVDRGVRYVNDSTAGAAAGEPTVGPVTDVAEMTVLSFDPVAERIASYRVLAVHLDATVTATAPAPWPSPAARPDRRASAARLGQSPTPTPASTASSGLVAPTPGG